MTSNWGIKGSQLKEAGNEELLNHQKFQVPKMEVLNLARPILRWVSLIHIPPFWVPEMFGD